MSFNELELWSVRDTCSIHGDYIYRAKKGEESVGCPICTVKQLKEQLKKSSNLHKLGYKPHQIAHFDEVDDIEFDLMIGETDIL